MTTHLGDKYTELEKRLRKHLGDYLDEFLRVEREPRTRNKRGDYGSENPWYMSAFFCALMERVDNGTHSGFAMDYLKFYQDEIFPLCEGNAYGTLSRQPKGNNLYPPDHREYKKYPFNRISRDEAVGVGYFANQEWREKLRMLAIANPPWDDSGFYDPSCKLPLTTRYYFIKLNQGKTTIAMHIMWHLDAAFDWLRIKIGFRNKSIADTVIKNYVRARAGVGKEPEKDLLVWATDFYFPDNHPFKKDVRRI